MGLLKLRSEPVKDRLTYHGSGPRRGILKHGGQAGRWRQASRQEGHKGSEAPRRSPRWW